MSKLEVRLKAIDEEAKRLRLSETSITRDVGIKSFINVSRSEADINRLVTSNITTRITPIRRTAPPSPKII